MSAAKPIRSGPYRDNLASRTAQMAAAGSSDPKIARLLDITVQQVRGLRRQYNIPAGEQRWIPEHCRKPHGKPAVSEHDTVISIDDRPILAAGYPGEDDAHKLNAWHGAMIRAVTKRLAEVHTNPEHRTFAGSVDWPYVTMALTVLADYIEQVHIPAADTPEGWVDDLPEKLDPIYLRGCPDDDFPGRDRKRTMWACAMTMAVGELLPEAQYEKDTVVAALSSFARYIRSDNGPLTWAAIQPRPSGATN